MMLIDSFLPEGVTRLAKDSIFMMPHLGVLSQVHARAATEVFEKDCLVALGTCIAPRGTAKAGRPALAYRLELPGGEERRETLQAGQMRRHRLETGAEARVHLDPARDFNVGRGKGVPMEATVQGGTVGLIFDCRGRPLWLPSEAAERIGSLKAWIEEIGVYSPEALPH